MKTKSTTLPLFTCKAILILTFGAVCLAGFIKCDAQSIAGKWKEVSGKDFCTEKGVKATGKEFLPQAPQKINIRINGAALLPGRRMLLTMSI